MKYNVHSWFLKIFFLDLIKDGFKCNRKKTDIIQKAEMIRINPHKLKPQDLAEIGQGVKASPSSLEEIIPGLLDALHLLLSCGNCFIIINY